WSLARQSGQRRRFTRAKCSLNPARWRDKDRAVNSGQCFVLSALKAKTAGPTPCRSSSQPVNLLTAVYRLLQFRPWGKLRDFAGGNLNGGTSLRVPAVAGLSLRDGKCAKPNQSHPISLFQSGGNAIHRGVDCSRCLCLADLACGRNTVNEIGFVHRFS